MFDASSVHHDAVASAHVGKSDDVDPSVPPSADGEKAATKEHTESEPILLTASRTAGEASPSPGVLNSADADLSTAVSTGPQPSSPDGRQDHERGPASSSASSLHVRRMRRLSSTASSLDADDEADASSHAATPHMSSSLSVSPAASRQRGARSPLVSMTSVNGGGAGGRVRKLAEGTKLTAKDVEDETPNGLPSLTSSPPASAPGSKREAVRGGPASSAESTTSSREASTVALSSAGPTSATASGLTGVEGDTQTERVGPSALVGFEEERPRPGGSKRSPAPSLSGLAELKRRSTAAGSSATNEGAAGGGGGGTRGSSSGASTPALSPAPVPPVLARGPSINMERFGCCVFFFPTPVLSWLFPLSGHVAISNAEGTRLYTFESSYFVREERVIDVLDRVIDGIRDGPAPHRVVLPGRSGKQAWRQEGARAGGTTTMAASAAAVESDGVAAVESDSPAPAPFLASASSGAEDEETSPSRTTARTSRFSPFPSRSRRGYAGSPIRRQVKQLSSFNSGSHSHTNCVRIWDLKPMLMESRGRGGGHAWLPLRLVSQATGGNGAVAALWQRLQELIPVDGTPVLGAGGSSSGSDKETPPTAPHHTADGAAHVLPNHLSTEPDAGHTGSGSETEEDCDRLLDSATARFYNRNLQATINIFRGSPEGSRAPLDIIVKTTNSYSFVGFVLEACGLGGGPAITTTVPNTDGAPAATTTSADASDGGGVKDGNAARSTAATPPAATTHTASPITPAQEQEIVVDGISWGVCKIWLNIFLFGEWHRSDRRVWRVAHGGTMASAIIAWTVLLAVLMSCVLPFLSGWWSGSAAAGGLAGGD